MFLPKDPNDYTEDDVARIVTPHLTSVRDYMMKNVIPQTCSYFIYSAYDLYPQEEDSLDIFINSSLSFFNDNFNKKQFEQIKNKTITILQQEYKLKVINQNPLELVRIGGEEKC